VPAKNMFLQAVLSVKLKVLSKIKELQNLTFALNLNIRLFAVASNIQEFGPYDTYVPEVKLDQQT
jgi:hypothetical protein